MTLSSHYMHVEHCTQQMNLHCAMLNCNTESVLKEKSMNLQQFANLRRILSQFIIISHQIVYCLKKRNTVIIGGVFYLYVVQLQIFWHISLSALHNWIVIFLSILLGKIALFCQITGEQQFNSKRSTQDWKVNPQPSLRTGFLLRLSCI